MSSINSLVPGQCLLTQAIKTNSDKIQLEFAEVLSSNGSNPLSMFNKSDERFRTRARRAWMTVELQDASELLGVNLGDDAGWELASNGKDVLPLNILNPNVHGLYLRVQVIESCEGDANSGLIGEYRLNNVETSAKRRGAGGDFITKNGKYIFSIPSVTFCKEGESPKHVFITDVDSVTAPAAAATMKVMDEVGL